MNATGTAIPPSNLDASSVHRTDVNNHLNRLTPLTLPPATAVTPLSCSTDGSSGSTTSTSGNLTLMHSNRSDTMESSGSSNSPLDSVGGCHYFLFLPLLLLLLVVVVVPALRRVALAWVVSYKPEGSGEPLG